MRALVQRVTEASVSVDDELVGAIGPGLCVLVGVTHDDDAATVDKLAAKLWHLRLFADDDGRMNRAVSEVGGEILLVSQFTLYGDTRKGRRPSWGDAADPAHAEPLVERMVEALRLLGAQVETGLFGAIMQVALVNDGPVTVLVEV